jgi:DNA polymerase III epsilon subunit-like protein
MRLWKQFCRLVDSSAIETAKVSKLLSTKGTLSFIHYQNAHAAMPLHVAAGRGHEAVTNGWTLHAAAIKWHESVTKQLIASRCNVDLLKAAIHFAKLLVTDPQDAALLKERLLNRRRYITDRFGFEEPADVLGEPQPHSFVLERIFTDADTKKCKVSVQGYESQGQLPPKDDTAALHRPAVPPAGGGGGGGRRAPTQRCAVLGALKKRVSQPAAFTGIIMDQISGAQNWDEVSSILTRQEIVFFDYETTGFPNKKTGDNSTNQPVQLGAVKVKDGQIIDRFNVFMNPEEPLGGWSRDNLKGADGSPLTDEQLATEMDKGEAHKQFIDWAGPGAILAAHNAPFDMGVLNDTLNKKGLEYTPGGVIDTLKLAQTVMPSKTDTNNTPDPNGPDTHRLGDLANHFGIAFGDGWHRADADCEATSKVLHALIRHAAGLDNADAIREHDTGVVDARGGAEQGARDQQGECPTPKQLQYAAALAAQRGMKVPEHALSNKLACSAFITEFKTVPFDGTEVHNLASTEKRQYLNVSFAEKDEAKKLGAKWDAGAKKWYRPPGVPQQFFTKWL